MIKVERDKLNIQTYPCSKTYPSCKNAWPSTVKIFISILACLWIFIFLHWHFVKRTLYFIYSLGEILFFNHLYFYIVCDFPSSSLASKSSYCAITWCVCQFKDKQAHSMDDHLVSHFIAIACSRLYLVHLGGATPAVWEAQRNSMLQELWPPEFRTK